jgi:hypothetical protein
MCYIYNDDDERIQIISDFIESGILEREKVFYAAYSRDGISPPALLPGLEAHVQCIQQDQFELLQAQEAYCPDGNFSPDQMLDTLRAMYTMGIVSGFDGVRASGEMAWALENMPGADRLIEYEARINTLGPEFPITLICQYDARRFDGATLFEVAAVHPAMIVGGQVVRNPYYILPEQYIPGRRQRSSTGADRV